MKMVYTCDYKGCNDFAQWCRKQKGRLLTLCTKHETELARLHWGRNVDTSKLSKDDIRYLERKERKKEFAEKHPFDVRFVSLEDGTRKVRIRDKQTDEKRSFVLKDADYKSFFEIYEDLEREGFSPKPSIDEYMKRLRKL